MINALEARNFFRSLKIIFRIHSVLLWHERKIFPFEFELFVNCDGYTGSGKKEDKVTADYKENGTERTQIV